MAKETNTGRLENRANLLTEMEKISIEQAKKKIEAVAKAKSGK